MTTPPPSDSQYLFNPSVYDLATMAANASDMNIMLSSDILDTNYVKYNEEGVEEITFLIVFVSNLNEDQLEEIEVSYSLGFF